MADNCCASGDGCSARMALRFPNPQDLKVVATASHDTDTACGCHGGVPRFDGLDPRYKRVLWTVIGLNRVMFLTEMIAGQLAGSQALKADALDFLADAVTYGLSLAVIGATLQTRATAARFKGLSLSLMAFWGFRIDDLPYDHSWPAERRAYGRNRYAGAGGQRRFGAAAGALQGWRRQCPLGLAVFAQ